MLAAIKSGQRRSTFMCVALLLSLAVSPAAVAAKTDTATVSHPMRFGHVTLEDGLSQSNVLSILQSSDGKMWFGTENGLNSYDGYEFNYYKRDRGNPDALSNDFIFDVVEDKDRNLWIATNGGGLAKLNTESGVVKMFRHDAAAPNSISGNVVRRLLIDRDSTIWVGTRGAGLNRFDPVSETFTRISLDSDSASESIFALHQDTAGAIWVGGDHGLTRLDSNTNAAVTVSGASDHSVRAILEDSDGQLWVGSFGGGLGRFDAQSNAFERFNHNTSDPKTLSSDQVSTIFEDSDGRIWVGTTDGLNLVNRSTGDVVRYSADNEDVSSLGDNDISSIYQDRSGLMWIGTKSHGLNKWNPRTWFYGFEPAKEISADGKSQANVMAFIDDGAGRLWVGTFGEGLNAIDRSNGDVTRYRSDADAPYRIAGDRVMSLLHDRSGDIWVGTMMNGITRLNPDSGDSTTYRHEEGVANSLSANGIMAMYEDRLGHVWIGTFGGGISRYNPGTSSFENFRSDPGNQYALSSDRVTSFAEDASGNMWIGTDAGGLNLFDRRTQRFYNFRHDPSDLQSLSSDTVYAVNVDANDGVWIGTQGGGLDHVVVDADRPNTVVFENVSQKHGLANDVVYGVQFDDNGWVWMSTNYGISRYNPNTGEIKNLHRKDGLQSEEFNFGAHYRNRAGELFFGGHNGYNTFDPQAIQPATIVPLVALTGFFSGGDSTKSDLPLNESEVVEFSWKDDVVAFEFAAMDFVAPEQNRYMYKLEGFDKDWIDLGNRRRATYTDLNDGHYLLRVKAANSDGVWNESGYTVPVRVTAAPWDTWWAYLAYLALLAQLVVGLWHGHRRKVRREEEYSHRLELEVRSRTEKLLDKNQQLKELNKALQETSLSDPLTGLRNRRFVFEEVSRDLDVIQRRLGEKLDGTDDRDVSDLVFMMIDLDNFKPINDTYGHAAGDEMLLQLRDVLLGICRRSDFVIRWGGDEFVVIAKQTRPDEAQQLAERIRSSIAEKSFMLGDGQIVRTTCSIGFAAYPLFRAQTDESSLDNIISLADELMYEAKKKRNAWVGMLGSTAAATSFDVDHDEIEPTSLLFRARRAGNLRKFPSDEDINNVPLQLQNTG